MSNTSRQAALGAAIAAVITIGAGVNSTAGQTAAFSPLSRSPVAYAGEAMRAGADAALSFALDVSGAFVAIAKRL